ncbi:glycoside hydrolase family 20 protein [Segetibacter koreensis]|uniref:glycoside hydrolase family 20 protein n=1 Tax=Segetibacter koreensis TaxID=398037 RepID=UPI000378469D|nr:family 20 glycosylhydrolase [Segetibacter koreensis]
MTKITIVLFLFFTTSLFAQDSNINIIPAPVSYKVSEGKFLFNNKTKIAFSDSAELNSANFLNDYLKSYYGFTLGIIRKAKAPSNCILLSTRRTVQKPEHDGRYTLTINPRNISIVGDTYQGTFYGIQTLLHMLPPTSQNEYALPCASIEDYPRFQYRGMHLDVGRHFFPVDFIKKYIDYIALYKMNTFHWHLTEDQGWRIEIKKYPKLTSVGGFRNGTIIGHHPGTGNDSLRYGGFYTQDEIRDVVKYAADRFITVIPEIELPGHSSAAIAAYPELSCFPNEPTKPAANSVWSGSREGKQVQQAWGVYEDVFCPSEYTFTFLENVLDEVMQLFPSQYIHIGGDECPKESWKRSEFCQQLIKEKGLKDEHGLQSYFIQRIEKYINSKGKKIIGWDEILEGGLAPNATVMSWRGEQGGVDAAKQKHNVVMTPGSYVYFDHSQSKHEDSLTIGGYLPVEVVYGYEPIPKELDSTEAKYVLGAQANIWTEYMKTGQKVEYQIFPRMSALSEVLWSLKEKRNASDFEKRMVQEFKRYDLWKANYSTAYYDIKSTITPAKRDGAILWSLESKSKAPIYITNNVTSAGLKYEQPLLISGSGNYTVSIVDQKKLLDSVSQNFSFNKATGKNITLANPPSAPYLGTGGAFGLVNGVKSEKGYPSDEWLGWKNSDLDAVIDLGKTQDVSKVSLDVWKQERSMIFLPKSVQISTSTDGKIWNNSLTQTMAEKPFNDSRKITLAFNQPTQARYVKIVAVNNGSTDSWLFADEIEVE